MRPIYNYILNRSLGDLYQNSRVAIYPALTFNSTVLVVLGCYPHPSNTMLDMLSFFAISTINRVSYRCVWRYSPEDMPMLGEEVASTAVPCLGRLNCESRGRWGEEERGIYWCQLRDWSLIMGRGGLQNGRGACEVLPLRKGGGGGKSFSHAEEGAQKFWGSFYTVAWSFSHIEGGAKSFHSLKGGRKKFDPVLSGGGGAKSFRPTIFPFCSPPPRN